MFYESFFLQKETIITEAAIILNRYQRSRNFYEGWRCCLNNTADQPFLYYEESAGGLLDHRTTVTRRPKQKRIPNHRNKNNRSEKPLRFNYKIHLQILVKIVETVELEYLIQ